MEEANVRSKLTMMTVALSVDLEEIVNAGIQSGNYLCVSEVVVRALYLLQDEDTLRQIKLERLRKDLAVGIEQADRCEVAPLDVEAIIAEGRKRLAVNNLWDKSVHTQEAQIQNDTTRQNA